MTPKKGERPAIEVAEEATGLLREAPASAYLAYFAGSLPFHLALLAFVGEMGRAADARRLLGGWSLVLAILFVAMRVGQSSFCRILAVETLGASREAVPFATVVLRQLRFQPPSL